MTTDTSATGRRRASASTSAAMPAATPGLPSSRRTAGKGGSAGATAKAGKRRPKRKLSQAHKDAVNKSRVGKYNASGRHVEGLINGKVQRVWQASEAQAVRCEQLLELQQRGAIANLECEVPYACVVNGVAVCSYRADFRYSVVDDLGQILRRPVEDVKGMITDVFTLKRKLVEACHRIELVLIPAKKVSQWAGRTA